MIIFRMIVSFAELIGCPPNLDNVEDFGKGGLFFIVMILPFLYWKVALSFDQTLSNILYFMEALSTY